MAIELKELIHREYDGNVPTSFEYKLRNNNGDEMLTAKFEKQNEGDERTWRFTALVDKMAERDTIVYDFAFQMPIESFDARKIAAFGLYALKTIIQEDVAILMGLDFGLGDSIGGMLGE